MGFKEIRKKTGLSQTQFAKRYDIPVRTLQQWEQGISKPAPYVELMLNNLVSNDEKPKSYIEKFRIESPATWKVMDGITYENADRIHPLQQRKVAELVDEILKNNEVTSIIIFGSSVTNHCHIGSDVDIYVEAPQKLNPLGKCFNFEFDLWDSESADERLKKEIMKKGVVVYHVGDNTV